MWSELEVGGGRASSASEGHYLLTLPPVHRGYADAQIDDTHSLPRRSFRWSPPVHLSLRARTSSPSPLGTLGFGFWNDPFAVSLGQGGAARRLPAGPCAIWFFYGSPPNELALAPGAPARGWKAACLASPQIPSLLLAPAAAAAALLAQVPVLRGPVLRAALSSVAASEAAVGAGMQEWHQYAIDWLPAEAIFLVDDKVVLRAPAPPRVPLGFVAWIDNQFAVVSPRAGFRFGVIPTDREQWLEMEGLSLIKG